MLPVLACCLSAACSASSASTSAPMPFSCPAAAARSASLLPTSSRTDAREACMVESPQAKMVDARMAEAVAEVELPEPGVVLGAIGSGVMDMAITEISNE
ncbi:hypothetical protein VaNZ11_016754, partial [Volvox africanus]